MAFCRSEAVLQFARFIHRALYSSVVSLMVRGIVSVVERIDLRVRSSAMEFTPSRSRWACCIASKRLSLSCGVIALNSLRSDAAAAEGEA